MKKLSLSLLLLIALSIFLYSCRKEDDRSPSTPLKFEQPALQDTVTGFTVYFYNPIDTSVEVGGYEDPDGPGPQEAMIGGVTLKANTYYEVTFMIEDATNPTKYVSILDKIRNNASNYKVCIDNPLGFSISAKDSDGIFPIGLINDLQTSSSTGSDVMNFTIKYQKNTKNGQCDPGSVYYKCYIPVTVY